MFRGETVEHMEQVEHTLDAGNNSKTRKRTPFASRVQVVIAHAVH